MDYTPIIPDELVEHFLGKSGFHSPDVRLKPCYSPAHVKLLAVSPLFKCSSESKPGPSVNSQVKADNLLKGVVQAFMIMIFQAIQKNVLLKTKKGD
ncbi:Transcription initiation factor TFIID subunit 10 [Linum perenne]